MGKIAENLICLDSLQLTNNDLFVRVSGQDLPHNTEIIVEDTHSAVLIKDGQLMSTLSAGRYPLYAKGDKGAIRRVDVIYTSKTAKLRALWGTKNRMSLRDPVTGVNVEVGANGEFEVAVANPRQMYFELIGAEKAYTVEQLRERLLARMMDSLEGIVAAVMERKNLCYAELGAHKPEIAAEVKEALTEMFAHDYGLKLHSFTIARVFVPDDSLERIAAAKRAAGAEKYYCPDCGREYRKGDAFCSFCGKDLPPLSPVCRKCGHVNVDGAVFCSSCGAKLK